MDKKNHIIVYDLKYASVRLNCADGYMFTWHIFMIRTLKMYSTTFKNAMNIFIYTGAYTPEHECTCTQTQKNKSSTLLSTLFGMLDNC